jgi:hypothetical protein
MELFTAPNIVAGVLALLLLFFLRQVFKGDIGDSRGANALMLVVLGVLLYLVRTEGGKAFIVHLLEVVR